MPRWYKAYRCVGKPDAIVQDVGRLVERNDLGQYLPVMRLERKARGEFYLFLGIESDVEGNLPDKLQEISAILDLRGTPGEGYYTIDQIKTMVTSELRVEDYARRIKYLHAVALPPDDPFAAIDLEQHELSSMPTSQLLQSSRYTELLLWLSATGNGSWESFRNACRTLRIDPDGLYAKAVARRLRLLGHMETSSDGSRWSIAPTVLSQLGPSDENTYILSGARDRQLLNTFREIATIKEIPQPYAQGPCTVLVYPNSGQDLSGEIDIFPSPVIIINGVAETYANILPSLVEWKNMLIALPGVLPHNYQIRRYDGSSFVPTPFTGEAGLYELWPLQHNTMALSHALYTLFYDANTDRWLRADWYGLHFLDLIEAGISCPVQYNSTTQSLAIPTQWRLPELYERAVVLASGRLPKFQGNWLVYTHISMDLLESLRTKLSLAVEGE